MMINQSIMSGTPVVAYDIGVARDLVIDGSTGYIASRKDVESLCTALLKIICTPGTVLGEMGSNARRIALEKYAREVVLARQEDIDVVLVGHFHTFGYVFPGVDVFMCGSFESTTAWLRRKGKRATVGGITFELGEGNETVLVPRFIRYEPIENDWVKHFRIFY